MCLRSNCPRPFWYLGLHFVIHSNEVGLSSSGPFWSQLVLRVPLWISPFGLLHILMHMWSSSPELLLSHFSTSFNKTIIIYTIFVYLYADIFIYSRQSCDWPREQCIPGFVELWNSLLHLHLNAWVKCTFIFIDVHMTFTFLIGIKLKWWGLTALTSKCYHLTTYLVAHSRFVF